jgi:hypothetical protein
MARSFRSNDCDPGQSTVPISVWDACAIPNIEASLRAPGEMQGLDSFLGHGGRLWFNVECAVQ